VGAKVENQNQNAPLWQGLDENGSDAKIVVSYMGIEI
jgi:hypothetical protein